MTPAKKLSFYALLVTCYAFLPFSAHAQQVGFSVIPPRVEFSLKPGQVVTKEIKIRNDSPTSHTITTAVKDFIVTDNLGTPVQVETNESQNRWAASNWIHVSPAQFTLKPGETKALVVSVIAPENATPGGHYSMILHRPDVANFNQSGSAVTPNVGTLVYITIAGNIKEDAKVDFVAPRFQEYGPVDFKATITNLSDVHITPVGAINIKNMFGQKIASLTLIPTNIFPYTSRDFQNTLKNRWLFGRFQAQFISSYGTTGQVLLANTYFWVIPLRLLISLIAIIILTLIIFFLNRRKKDPSVKNPELEKLHQKYQDRR